MSPVLADAIGALPARAALERVWRVLPEARLVGGVVRDLLCGRIAADLDLATPEPPDAVMRMLVAAGIRVVPTGLAHGTVTALPDGRPVEITTLRRDVETDGRHAVVAWTADWREDAARRDFTINAMSADRAGLLHDFFGGAADLAAGRVRFVGDPVVRIEEDGLRMLRFFRFQARFGHGAPDPDALAAIAAAASRIARLSAERVWSELRRLLEGPGPIAAVALMQRTGVLDVLLPDGAMPGRLRRLEQLGAPADALLRLAALVRAPAAVLARAWRLSGAEADRLAALQDPPPPPEPDADALRRLLADEPAAILCDRAWLAAAAEPEPDRWATLRARLAGAERPVFPLAGRDAVAVGIAPGPRVGAALREVRDWWRAGGCRAGRDACLARLAAIPAG